MFCNSFIAIEGWSNILPSLNDYISIFCSFSGYFFEIFGGFVAAIVFLLYDWLLLIFFVSADVFFMVPYLDIDDILFVVFKNFFYTVGVELKNGTGSIVALGVCNVCKCC